MSMIKALALVLLPASVVCSSCVSAEDKHCAFDYTPELASKLVVPELKKNFSGAYVYFDFDDPVISEEHGHIVVQLSATRRVDGRRLAFEDLFFVEIEPCTQKVLRSFASQQYRTEPE